MRPAEVVAVFEAESCLDKYTVVLNEKPFVNSDFYTGLALSENPQSPQGVCMFTEVLFNPGGDNYHLGKQIDWEKLPKVVRETVIEKL
jgi:hypothetical protein